MKVHYFDTSPTTISIYNLVAPPLEEDFGGEGHHNSQVAPEPSENKPE